jgi:hypothetical protein
MSNISLAWIPDIHLENKAVQPKTWQQQAAWIKDHQAAYNIQGVLCAGDIFMSNSGTDTLARDLPTAWPNGFETINSMGVPYLVAAGNHDYDGPTDDSVTPSQPLGSGTWDTTYFDMNIGYSKIRGYTAWYAGCWGAPGYPGKGSQGNSSKATQAIKIEAGGRKLLVIALEYLPRDGALEWAADQIDKNPDHEVIIVTHAYMTMSGLLFDKWGNDYDMAFMANTACEVTSDYTVTWSSPPSQETFKGLAVSQFPDQDFFPGGSTGTTILAWAKKFANIKLILCGHDIPEVQAPPVLNQNGSVPSQYSFVTAANDAHRVDLAHDGHPICGIFANYQCMVYPGHGMHNSEVVLLLELEGLQLRVRAFNTSTGEELLHQRPYPYLLPWWRNSELAS